MKLILLICLIGAAMSATTLTTGTATLWTLTYLTPAATTNNYNLTVAYSTGVTASATVATSGQEIGVICLLTVANYTLTASATVNQTGFAFGQTATGTATNSAAAFWGPLKLTSFTSAKYASDTSITAGTVVADCALVTPTAPAYAAFVHTYSFSSVAVCPGLGIKGALWYARCFHKTATTVLTTGTTGSFVVSAAKNVTVGASTFAAGATILAGIAYLQF
jgi:hypothetical protein